MKTFVKPFSLLFLMTGLFSFQIDPPEPGSYSNYCDFDVGEYVNYIWYNDPDGDCKTTDWYLVILFPDGQTLRRRSIDFHPPLEWDLSQNENCCPLTNNSGSGGSGGSNDGDSDWTNCPPVPIDVWVECVYPHMQ